MIPWRWYDPLLYLWWRMVAWSPVVIRRGKLVDLEGDLKQALVGAELALDALEHGGEEGIHSARSILYHVIS